MISDQLSTKGKSLTAFDRDCSMATGFAEECEYVLDGALFDGPCGLLLW